MSLLDRIRPHHPAPVAVLPAPSELERRREEFAARVAELGEVERLLRADTTAEAGSCEACGAPHSRGAAFCFQCGAALLETQSMA